MTSFPKNSFFSFKANDQGVFANLQADEEKRQKEAKRWAQIAQQKKSEDLAYRLQIVVDELDQLISRFPQKIADDILQLQSELLDIRREIMLSLEHE